MSTHGCLTIRARGEDRQVTLYTTHTGQGIPAAVLAAPVEHAVRRFFYLRESGSLRRKYGRSRRALEECLSSSAADDGLGWPPAVASWIIAAKPNLLMPLPGPFTSDLADWSGIDHPYKLVVAEDTWMLHSQEGERLWEVEPYRLMVEAVWERVRYGHHQHDCERAAPPGFLTSGERQDGARWTCPVCRSVWVHVCDEAEGCSWSLVHRGEGGRRRD